MGNSIIFIIIGVLLVAVIAWVFINKNKKQNSESAKPRPVANPVPRHLQEEPTESIPERNYLNNAQSFINQQRYDEAENELKAGLKEDKSNNDLTLKLLNVYALTSNRDAFDTLYEDFYPRASDTNLQQANDLKSMLAEEESLQTAAQSASATTDTIDNTPLEFNLDDDDVESPSSSAADDSADDAISFDDLESQLLDESSSTSPVTDTATDDNTFDLSDDIEAGLDSDMSQFDDQPVSLDSTDDVQSEASDFDLTDFDDFSTDNDDAINSVTADSDTASDESFDFSLDADSDSTETVEASFENDTPLNTPVNATADDTATDSDDEFDFSFDDVEASVDEQNESTPTKELSLDDVDVGDNTLSFDSELAMSTEADSTPASVTEEDSLSFDDLDFDTNTGDTNTGDTNTENTTVATDADLNTDSNDFDFDLSDELDSESTEDMSIQQSADAETTLDWDEELSDTDTEIKPALDNNITLESDTLKSDIDTLSQNERLGAASAIAASAVAASTMTTDTDEGIDNLEVNGSGISDDELNDTEVSSTPVVNEVTDTLTSDFDTVSDDAQDITPESIVPESTAPAGSTTSLEDSEFAEAFGFVQELDNSQITLDLASQYLELGEYESARRLVDEVLQSSVTEDQKRTAQDILARMD